MDDHQRIEAVLQKVANRKTSSGAYYFDQDTNPISSLDDECERFLVQSTKELASSIIEQAMLAAKHRNASEIGEEDIRLILNKLYNIRDIRDAPNPTLRQILNLSTSASNKILLSSTPLPPSQPPQAIRSTATSQLTSLIDDS